MQKNFEIQANEAVIEELLDLMTNDSENLERTLKLLTDDCVWVMEPSGTEYHGIAQIKTFTGIVPPNGRNYKMNVASFFRVNANGMITEMRNYFDRTTFMEQTGIDLVSMQKNA